jgi:hypothetical protein
MNNQKRSLIIFLLLWLIINLLQAGFTELANDEAYYWMYSNFLDWGYFDHPPMIALLIKAGYLLFNNELGVRLLPVFLGVGTIFIIFQLTESKKDNNRLLIILLISVTIVHTHIGGFFAIPDLPVIFFSTLFFYFYKHYLKEDKVQIAILLGITGAAMLYSKYHGVLVFVFTLLSSLSLLKRKSFWLIPTVVALGMLPHLLWQIKNGFPTFQYHLVGRADWYSFKDTMDFVLGQLIIANPLIVIFLFYHAFRRRAQDGFERALKFNMIGFMVFFFISSFRGHVEPHWTAIAYVPAIVLAYNNISPLSKTAKWLNIFVYPSIVIFIVLRLVLMINLLPTSIPYVKEFHNWDKAALEIRELAGKYKVVFINSFQKPSKYSFYSKEYSHSLNSVYYRRNQYDLWPMKDSLMGADVLIMTSTKPDSILHAANGDTYKFKRYHDFRFYYEFDIDPANYNLHGEPGDTIYTKISFTNTKSDSIQILTSLPEKEAHIVMAYRPYGEEWLKQRSLLNVYGEVFGPGEKRDFNIKITAPDQKGEYWLYFGIENDLIPPRCQLNPVILQVQ